MLVSFSNFQSSNNNVFRAKNNSQCSFGSAFHFSKAPDGKLLEKLNMLDGHDENDKLIALLTKAAWGDFKFQDHNIVESPYGERLEFTPKDASKGLPETITYSEKDNSLGIAFVNDMPMGNPIKEKYEVLKKIFRIQEYNR